MSQLAAPAATQSPWRQAGVFAILSLIWGSTWLVIRDQLGTVPPGWSVTWRFVLAAAAMFALARWRGSPLRLSGRSQTLALAVGTLLFAGNFQLVYRAEAYLTSGVVAIIFTLLFAYNAALSRIFLGRRVGSWFLVGSAVAVVGIGLLLVNETRRGGAGEDVWVGTAMVLGALFFASCGNVLQSTRSAQRLPVFTLLAWAMLWGAVANAVLAWALAGVPRIELRPTYLGGVAYLALIGSVAAFPLYFRLLGEMGPAKGGYVNVAVPIVAMTLSTLFEGYRWSLLATGGVAVALAGMGIALAARDPIPAPSGE